MTQVDKSGPTPARHGDRYLDRVTAGKDITSAHVEGHFMASDVVRDVVIGMSDGLTVPFALAAGLTGAIAASRLIVTAGLAEVVAGSIAMGLGGYLAARSEAEHYASEVRREQLEIETKPEAELAEVREVFERFGLTLEESERVARTLSTRPSAWVDFMMRFELGLEEPDFRRALRSALTIAFSYIVAVSSRSRPTCSSRRHAPRCFRRSRSRWWRSWCSASSRAVSRAPWHREVRSRPPSSAASPLPQRSELRAPSRGRITP